MLNSIDHFRELQREDDKHEMRLEEYAEINHIFHRFPTRRRFDL
jgi:hypothetical protein